MAGGDRLILSGMQFFGHHGDIEAERVLGGRLDVDVELHADLSVAAASDRLGDTLDYARCFELVRDVVENRQYNLLEAVAENIAACLLENPLAQSVSVRVAKQPPLRGVVQSCAVVIERSRPEDPS
ncbi:MAG: dihydroneopterin aldolase [Candidatus Dormibacteria bacterium]